MLMLALTVSSGCKNSNASGSTVTGRSLRFPVNSGVPFVRVLVNGDNALRFQVTDSNGSFTMLHVPVGTYQVKFARFGVLLYSTRLVITENEETYVVNMPSVQTGSNPVQGVIMDSGTDEVISDAEIWVIYPDGGLAYAITDENGEYRLENLPDGMATISVITDGYLPLVEENVQIESEGSLKLDFTLDVIPDFDGGIVTGVVRTQDGEILEDAYVGIFDNNVQPSIYMVARQETLSATDGYTLGDIPPGTYTVICTHSGYALDSELLVVEENQVYSVDFVLDAEKIIPSMNDG